LNPFDPGRLKAPSFNPCAYEVKILVLEKFASKFNLYRFTEDINAARFLGLELALDRDAVGLCTLESS
jgi:hypothetical protein